MAKEILSDGSTRRLYWNGYWHIESAEDTAEKQTLCGLREEELEHSQITDAEVSCPLCLQITQGKGYETQKN